jgi:tRNA pseudouridine38-40 synthase
MPRYFLSVRYMGTRYAGSQVQDNAVTIQGELEKAMEILFREKILLTGSSRTDAGVHAISNYYHFDRGEVIAGDPVYQINAILPGDIAVNSIREVTADAHSRFDATARAYDYMIYDRKDPFLSDRGWYFPYPLDIGLLNEAAGVMLGTHDFTSFAKRNAQVHTHQCTILKSKWKKDGDVFIYSVKGNRFLRGMVRGLVATMSRVGRGKMSLDQLHEIIRKRDCTLADFSAPAQGLQLKDVYSDEGIFL